MPSAVPTSQPLQEFRPLPLLTNPHVQTLVAAKLAWSLEPPSVTRLVKLPDDDTIALEVSTPQGWQPDDQTVLLLHGLCGCHRSPYMQRMARKLLRCGIRAVRMNLRGCGSGRGLARSPYHSGRSADVLAVLDSLQQAFPRSPMTLVGFSLGGNIILKLAGEWAALVPANVQRVIALCAEVAYLQARFSDLPPVKLPQRLSLYEFDEYYTAPRCGFRDALDYYRQCSAAPLVPRITMPCHMLFAADDPMVDAHAFDGVALPPNVQVLCTSYGGHLGFLGRPGRPGGYRAMDAQLLAWITAP